MSQIIIPPWRSLINKEALLSCECPGRQYKQWLIAVNKNRRGSNCSGDDLEQELFVAGYWMKAVSSIIYLYTLSLPCCLMTGPTISLIFLLYAFNQFTCFLVSNS